MFKICKPVDIHHGKQSVYGDTFVTMPLLARSGRLFSDNGFEAVGSLAQRCNSEADYGRCLSHLWTAQKKTKESTISLRRGHKICSSELFHA